jgi:hypothetical protein
VVVSLDLARPGDDAWDPCPYSRYVEPLARVLLQERGHDAASIGFQGVPYLPSRPGEAINPPSCAIITETADARESQLI